MKLCKNIVLLFFGISISCYGQSDKWVVITTIAHPTAAVKKLAQCSDWNIVIVADKKTPADWNLPGCHFLSVEQQQTLSYNIISYLPFNHYVRKKYWLFICNRARCQSYL